MLCLILLLYFSGGRDSYNYAGNRRDGHPVEEEAFQGGRSRDFFQGAPGYQQGGYPQDDKPGFRHRGGDHSAAKGDLEGSAERDHKRAGRRPSKERAGNMIYVHAVWYFIM